MWWPSAALSNRSNPIPKTANFATIVRAVEEGRSIYENIQKFLRFLFPTNLSEVLAVASGVVLASVLNLRDETGALMAPLTAAQILWINLMTDGLPALVLAFDRTPAVMRQPPRPVDSPLLDRESARFVVGAGGMKAVPALAVLGLVPRLGYDLDIARAVAFHFMAIGQLLLTYPSRHTWTRPLIRTDEVSVRWAVRSPPTVGGTFSARV